MKKYAIFALLFAAVAAFAAFDVTKAPNVIPVAAPQTIADGTTNYAVFTARSLIGSIGEASNVSAFIMCY